MYLAVDIGGSKTLASVFGKEGDLIEEVKFATPQDYDEFIGALASNVATLTTKQFATGCMAVPGLIDRKKGFVHALGNLPWVNKYIRDDVTKALGGGINLTIENDTKLAGLYEGLLISDTYEHILYVTVSTGIGGALIYDRDIVKATEDMEIGKIPLQYDGRIQQWEEFASGRAIVAKYGKRASEIEDPKIWYEIGQKIGYGLAIVCSVIQPEAVVFGGGAGQFAEKFIPAVEEYIHKYKHAIVRCPPMLTGKNPTEAVIYGCFEMSKRHHEKISATQ